MNPLIPESPVDAPLTVNEICANEKNAPNLFAKFSPALLLFPTKSSKEKLKVFFSTQRLYINIGPCTIKTIFSCKKIICSTST
ncbi:MAG: hypothetical protein IPP27_02500 [Bacteroidetes bacterium]|nr:hypothetical protein [Bacteroidota bacterium]